jgi:hypothetical protein
MVTGSSSWRFAVPALTRFCAHAQQSKRDEDEDGEEAKTVTDPLGLLGTLSLPSALDPRTRFLCLHCHQRMHPRVFPPH